MCTVFEETRKEGVAQGITQGRAEEIIETGYEFGLSDAQAQAIVDMRLRALTGLERGKIEAEYAQLKKEIEELKAILALVKA